MGRIIFKTKTEKQGGDTEPRPIFIKCMCNSEVSEGTFKKISERVILRRSILYETTMKTEGVAKKFVALSLQHKKLLKCPDKAEKQIYFA